MSAQEQFVNLQQKLRPLNLYSLNGNTLVDAELKAYAQGLNILANKLDILQREIFINTAIDFGLALREKLFGRIKSSVSATNRREMLNYRNSITVNDFTKEDIKNSMTACGLNTEIQEYFDGEKIYIRCLSLIDDFSSKNQAIAAAQEFLPAHLQVEFDFRDLTWNYIDSLEDTFNEFEAKNLTWNQIDTYNEII